MTIDKHIFLLTKQFPYLNREQYVAHELEYLAAQFEKVYIYPHDYFGKNDEPSFVMPPNVEVVNLNSRIQSDSGKWRMSLSFLNAFFYEFFRTHDRIWLLKNAKRFFYIYCTQHAIGDGITRFVQSRNLGHKKLLYYSYWFGASALCLAILKSRKRIPAFVSRAHALDLYHEDWGLLNEKVKVLPFRNFKQKHVDVLYSITAHGKFYLNKKYPLIQNVQVAYLGVQDGGLNPVISDNSDIFVIATCSGIDDNKRIHQLGEALSRLNKPVRWFHFGDGPLKQSAINAITSGKIDFRLMGQVPNAEIRRFYAQQYIDLFVNISRVEGLPVTIMEAMAHGIPVLATNTNGTPEAVIENQTGKLIDVAFSQSDIDRALEWLMTNPEELLRMRSEARRLFEQRFNAEVNYQKFTSDLIAFANSSVNA